MKNIITILLILILPILTYIYLSNNSQQNMAVAKNRNLPTVLVFTSTMCMDCQKIKAVLAEIEPMYSDKINFEYVHALDKTKSVKDAIKKYGISLVPTIVFLDKETNQLSKVEGFMEKDKLISEIEGVING